MSHGFNTQQIAFIKQLIGQRNKEIRHEVSDHIDNSLPVKKIASSGEGSLLVDSGAGGMWLPPAPSDGSVVTRDTSQAGGVKWAGPAAVNVYNPDYAGAATITDNAERVLDWNSEAYDHGGFHAAGASDIVVPTGYGGIYHIDAEVAFTTAPAAAHQAYIRVSSYNASSVLQHTMYDSMRSPAGMAVGANVTFSRDMYLPEGYFIRVSVWQNSGGSLTMNQSAYRSMVNMHRVAVV